MNGKDFIPPIMVTIAKRIRRRTQLDQAFDAYEEALLHCPTNAYESDILAEVVFQKTLRVVTDSSQRVAGLGDLNGVLGVVAARGHSADVVNVLDVGGACGAHYFFAKAVFQNCALRWCVLETQAMVARAGELSTDELTFTTTVEDALRWLGHLDLLHSSYALPYFREPARAVEQFVSLNARVMLWARLPLTELRPYTVVQATRLSANGPGPLPTGVRDGVVTNLETFLDRRSFESIVSQKYSIIASYIDPGGDKDTPREHIKGRSYLLVKKMTDPRRV